MTGPALLPLVDAAILAAMAGGRAIMQVYGNNSGVQWKADQSPLTQADLDSHTVIDHALAATALPVMSEEGPRIPANERQSWPLYWLVDPLDGTKEFVARNDEFAVCIALMRSDTQVRTPLGNAMPVVGVVYGPVQDVLYFAWEGGGAWRHCLAATHGPLLAYERAAMSTRLPAMHGLRAHTILASRSHRNPETEAFILRSQQEHGSITLAYTGSALKFGRVAEGSADAYPRFGPTMEWDTAAGQILCTEAGRRVIDVTTDAPLRYNKNEPVNHGFIAQ